MTRLLVFLLFAASVFGADLGPTYIGPAVRFAMGGAVQARTCVLNSSTTKCAWVFQSEVTGTISTARVWQSANTGTARSCTLSLQALDASGNPDGTALSSGSFASGTSAAFRSATLSYAATLGEKLALVADCSNADGSNTVTLYQGLRDGNGQRGMFPFASSFDGATWTRIPLPGPLAFGYSTATKDFGTPYVGYTNTQANSTTNQRVAVKFSLPSGACSTYLVHGISGWFGFSPNTSASFAVAVWDASGDEISASTSPVFTAEEDGMSNGSATVSGSYYLSAPVTLNCGTEYRIGVKYISGGSTGPFTLTFDSANDRALMGSWIFSNHNGTSWADTATSLPVWNLIVTDITAPAGGGGGEHAYPLQ